MGMDYLASLCDDSLKRAKAVRRYRCPLLQAAPDLPLPPLGKDGDLIRGILRCAQDDAPLRFQIDSGMILIYGFRRSELSVRRLFLALQVRIYIRCC
jgi:hypothetical protein